jgi:hypothetical protein
LEIPATCFTIAIILTLNCIEPLAISSFGWVTKRASVPCTETGLSGPYQYHVMLVKDDQPVGQASAIMETVHG